MKNFPSETSQPVGLHVIQQALEGLRKHPEYEDKMNALLKVHPVIWQNLSKHLIKNGPQQPLQPLQSPEHESAQSMPSLQAPSQQAPSQQAPSQQAPSQQPSQQAPSQKAPSQQAPSYQSSSAQHVDSIPAQPQRMQANMSPEQSNYSPPPVLQAPIKPDVPQQYFQGFSQPTTPNHFFASSAHSSSSSSNSMWNMAPGMLNLGTQYSGVLKKPLREWTAVELQLWISCFRGGHYMSVSEVFKNITGFDLATIQDHDFQAHVNFFFKQSSMALVALSCWRQLQTYKRKPEDKQSQKRNRRRKRPPICFGNMLQILTAWQSNIDTGVSENTAARMLRDERVCRTTLRSWRHITRLAAEHNIDLSSPLHASRSVSLSYVHKLVDRQQTAGLTGAVTATERPPPAL